MAAFPVSQRTFRVLPGRQTNFLSKPGEGVERVGCSHTNPVQPRTGIAGSTATPLNCDLLDVRREDIRSSSVCQPTALARLSVKVFLNSVVLT